MLGLQAVIVAYHAAGFRPELVRRSGELSEKGESGARGHYVENVGVDVKIIETVRMGLEERGEDAFGFVEIWGKVGNSTTMREVREVPLE